MLRVLVLYMALSMGANAAAETLDWDALREGGLERLVITDPAAPVTDTAFTDPDGGEHRLSDRGGQVVLLNFWATWCAPCREEMPSLDRLQALKGSDDFAVVTVASGRNSLTGIEKFYKEAGIETLPVLLDPRSALAREFGVLAMPATILIDAEGREIARLMGEAEWDSEAAQRLIDAVVASQ